MDTLVSLVEAFEVRHAQHQATLPVSLRFRRAQGKLELTVEDVHPALRVTLDPTGVTVAVHWQGEVWDLLLSEDLAAVAEGSRWHCSICASSGKWTAFDSLAALYQDHLFDPLAHWLRHSLQPATNLVLYRTAGGATWASLVKPATPPPAASAVAVLPMQRQSGASG